MTEREQAAVCIVGGGPAGAALAIRLAQLGHRAVLVERGRAPRRRVGELLSPGVWTQLDLLAARATIEAAGFPELRRMRVEWEEGGPPTREFAGEAGLLVDRARFDAIMLDVATAHGVRVLHPAVIRERRFDGDAWRLQVEKDGRSINVEAAFLALAGGRAALPHRARRATGPRTLALYAAWRGVGLPPEPHLEAGADEWYWGMPLPDGDYSTMAFVDPASFRRQRTVPLACAFRRLIGASKLLGGCRRAELAGPVRAADATPFVADVPVDRHSIRIGEAALAIDPLSSSGLQRAMQSALTGAVVVNTLLRRPDSGDVARGFYRDSLEAASNRHRHWAAARYRAAAGGRDSGFWHERAANADAEPAPKPAGGPAPHPELPVALAPDTALVARPCIVGEFVESRHAVRPPGNAEPVAFVAGHDLAPLLLQLRPGMTAGDLVRSWSCRVAPRSGVAIVGWLLETGVLIAPQHRPSGGGLPANP